MSTLLELLPGKICGSQSDCTSVVLSRRCSTGRMFANIPVTQISVDILTVSVHGNGGCCSYSLLAYSFILGVLVTTIWQYHDLMTRSVGFRTERLAVGQLRTTENLSGQGVGR